MQGFSKIFDKIITKKKTITSSDMTPDEKKRLYAFMARYDATQAFTYDRFFEHGFQEWEIVGIDAIKREFLMDHNALAEGGDAVTLAPGYVAEEGIVAETVKRLHTMAAMYNGKGDFFRYLTSIRGMRSDLYKYMADRGMKSNTTTLRRFTEDNWLKWERIGIKTLLEEYGQEEEAIIATAV